jgi:para-nitrobenzyl esterase
MTLSLLPRLSALFLLFSAATFASTPSKAASAKAGAPHVTLSTGELEGSSDANGVRSFKGIPYAEPPVGDLRWREPQPVKPWSGVRSARAFGNTPMQRKIWDDIIFRSKTMSEDCLYLNVWAPAASNAGDGHPVLVYFHGGGMAVGDGSEARYDGTSFARQGIVAVTINYRLGLFGFFAHPALTAESPHHASGNYAFLDQNAALRWVQANIAAFGGDPHRVTIAGQSAGSASVCAQMASPLSAGLFSGAIGQSGSMLGNSVLKPLAEAERDGVAFAESLGASTLEQLRKLPARQLLDAPHQPVFPQSIVDGYFLPQAPYEIFFAGRQNDVPLLGGWTSAEVDYHSVIGKDEPTVKNYEEAVRRLYGERADDALKLYPVSDDASVRRVATDLARDRFAGYRTWSWLDVHAKSGGKPVYRYLFSQVPPAPASAAGSPTRPPEPPLGAAHSADIAYALGNLDALPGITWTDGDRRASAAMEGYFVNFIKAGNPNGGDLPHWTWLQGSIPRIMVIEAQSHTIPEPDLKRYLFLDSLAHP